MGTAKDKLKLNVGGRIFETTATTLAIAGHDSLFRAMLDEKWNSHSGSAVEHFIDRDPDYFAILLNLLRTGELYIPPHLHKNLLYQEAEYYGILDHVRSATWGPLDGNRARLTQSITGWSARDKHSPHAIRASPRGGCCVAQGSIVRMYDWMLEQHPIIHMEHNKVNDVCWVDSDNIVVTFNDILVNGCIWLFNASTGELKCKFEAIDESRCLAPIFTATTVECSDCKMFSSCNVDGEDWGIGIWDRVTSKVIGRFHRPADSLSKSATRLQWLAHTNSLMALYPTPANDVCLYDIRENGVVWKSHYDEHFIADAVAIEQSTICVLSSKGCLGFMDVRSSSANATWREEDSLSGVYFPKLGFYNGQLFSSTNNRISVYCGSDFHPTSQLRWCPAGPIRDFSIGGDRIFALHKDGTVIDVWETPRPII